MILDILLPNRCLECNRIITKNDVVCEICIDKVNFSHQSFQDNNTLKERLSIMFPIENAYSLMLYEKDSLVQKIIYQLKYNHRERIGKNLAEWTIKKVNFGKSNPDLLITVPLHSKKLKKRGYNQLHLFGKCMSESFQIPIDNNLLIREMHSKAQAMKNKIERVKTDNDFQITKELVDKHILLIDDVCTTGNTISNIAWEILKNSKNVKISVLVMAMDV